MEYLTLPSKPLYTSSPSTTDKQGLSYAKRMRRGSNHNIKSLNIAVLGKDGVGKSGKVKLNLGNGKIYAFLEDGTEIDDDETLLALDKGIVLIVTESTTLHDSPKKEETPRRGTQESVTLENAEVFGSTLIDDNPTMETDDEDPILASDLHTSPSSSCTQESVTLENAEVFGSTLIDDNPSMETDDEDPILASDPDTSSSPLYKNVNEIASLFQKTPHKSAKMKGLKIYSTEEIERASTELEKSRRRFWNDKAEQLATAKKTHKLDKTTLYGIIDVSWTLRKTSILESQVNILENEEKALFEGTQIALSGRKLGKQKKDTVQKNLGRMTIAHRHVENLNEQVEDVKKVFESGTSHEEKKKAKKKFDTKKTLLDGAYTDLKRAQEALSKSLKQKRLTMERELAKDKKGSE